MINIEIKTFILFPWDFLKLLFHQILYFFAESSFTLPPSKPVSRYTNKSGSGLKQRANTFLQGDFWDFFMYFIQHYFICRASDSTVSGDDGIEPRTVATSALAVRRSNHSAKSHSQGANTYPSWACCPVSCRGRPVRRECWSLDRKWNRGRTLTQTWHAAQFPVEGDQWGENAGALTGSGTETI